MVKYYFKNLGGGYENIIQGKFLEIVHEYVALNELDLIGHPCFAGNNLRV